jgi:hypothetical protein
MKFRGVEERTEDEFSKFLVEAFSLMVSHSVEGATRACCGGPPRRTPGARAGRLIRPVQPFLVARPPVPVGCTRSSTTVTGSSPASRASAFAVDPLRRGLPRPVAHDRLEGIVSKRAAASI